MDWEVIVGVLLVGLVVLLAPYRLSDLQCNEEDGRWGFCFETRD